MRPRQRRRHWPLALVLSSVCLSLTAPVVAGPAGQSAPPAAPTVPAMAGTQPAGAAPAAVVLPTTVPTAPPTAPPASPPAPLAAKPTVPGATATPGSSPAPATFTATIPALAPATTASPPAPATPPPAPPLPPAIRASGTPAATATAEASPAASPTPSPTPSVVISPTLAVAVAVTATTPASPTPLAPPIVVRLDAPADGAILNGQSRVSGTVTGGRLRQWTLDYRSASAAEWEPFASGSNEAISGTLDPAVWRPGLYEVRLSVADPAGHLATASSFVLAPGPAGTPPSGAPVLAPSLPGAPRSGTPAAAGDIWAVGETLAADSSGYRQSVVDVEPAAADRSVRVARSYDSRDRRVGDFGRGWSLDVADVRLETSGPLGLGWEVVAGPGGSACLRPTRTQRVVVGLPDGRLLLFRPSVATPCVPGGAPEIVALTFEPLDGSAGGLAPVGDVYVEKAAGLPRAAPPYAVTLLDFGTGAPLDPGRFDLTLADGTQVTLGRTGAAEHITHPAGRGPTVDRDGIGGGAATRLRLERDGQGRITRIVDPGGRAMRYGYDADGFLRTVVDREGRRTSYTYSPDGRLASVADSAGRVTRLGYDRARRLAQITFPDGAAERREYDGAGRVVATIDAHRRRSTLEYDARGRLVALTDASGRRQSVAYDQDGQPETLTTPGGDLLRFRYDQRKRLVERTLPDATSTTYTYAGDGAVAGVTGRWGTTRYDEDAAHRLTRIALPDGRYLRYEYDASGRRTLLAHAMVAGGPETIVRYVYAAAGRVVEVRDESGSTRQSFDLAGNRTSVERPNGVVSLYAYDARDQITSAEHYGPDGVLLAGFGFSYDSAGNRILETSSDGHRVEYGYDAAGRLTREQHSGGAGRLEASFTYSYDGAGNLTRRGGPAGEEALAYDATGRLTTAGQSGFTLDPAGSRVASFGAAGARYVYDALGRLARIEPQARGSIAYTYSAGGTRQSRSDGTGTVYYLTDEGPSAGTLAGGAAGEARVLRESDDAARTRRTYTYAGAESGAVAGAGALPLSLNEGGQTYFVLDDGSGTVRLITDVAGHPVVSFAFLSFGAPQPGSGGAGDQSVNQSVYLDGRRRDLEGDVLVGFDGFARDTVRDATLNGSGPGNPLLEMLAFP